MVLRGLDSPGPLLPLLAVAVVHLDAHLAPHAAPVDVEHVAVGLTDRLLHQVTVTDVDLLLQSFRFPDILWTQTINVNYKIFTYRVSQKKGVKEN